MILLDTCVLIWLAADQRKLSEIALRQIADSPGTICVSAISAFEIGIKHRQKKLELPLPAMEWFSEVLTFHGICELPVTSKVAINSVQLPPLHNDPCDRIIIATAMVNSMSIITCDTLISQYEQAKVIW